MNNLIFAFMQAQGGDEREALLLARSLRKFGGKLANQPAWLMEPKQEQVSISTRQALSELDVRVNSFEVPEEALAANEADILVWMDSDTVFAGEPSEFLIGDNFSLGYRPVMLKNISSLFDQPLDLFWGFIYKQCDTPMGHIYSMLTSIDEVRIRPQFNAGVMSVRPEKSLLQTWQDNFERLYRQPELASYYEEHVLYRIFVHQAILSATLLAILHKDEMQDLGERINLPMFLKTDSGLAREALTMRYDEYQFFEKSGWEEKITLREPFQGWLRAQVGPQFVYKSL